MKNCSNSIAQANDALAEQEGNTQSLEGLPELARGLGAETSGFSDRYAAARPLEFSATNNKLNHGVFRYPAKFHPPIARRLIELVTTEGQTVLDPFCGSGTLLVEAAVLGRNSVGADIDPLAVFITRAKTSLDNDDAISEAAETFTPWLHNCRAEDENLWGAFDHDIDEATFEAARPSVADYIPELPNIHHWFRRRAIIQLAKIRRHVDETQNDQSKLFLKLCFASIIRNSSNADPVPISGLEVTSHMLAKEAEGRAIDPWRLMSRAIAKTLEATRTFIKARSPTSKSLVYEADARSLELEATGKAAAVVTSPPYLTAVDYYRRHTLEMYWLGLTIQPRDRLALMARYIGRDRIGEAHFAANTAQGQRVANSWIPRFPGIKPERERAFRHYCDGMSRALDRMLHIVAPGGAIVIVAGDVRFNGTHVSMLELMKDLAGDRLVISDHLWYPIINRYMSYSRRNEANIAADHVLVFRSAE